MTIKKQIFTYLLVLFCELTFAQFRFEQFANNGNLLLTNVSCITQDAEGYIWLSASNGLYRYDGYNFKPYPHDETNKYSISDNNTNVVYIDKEGMLWVGTRNGLNCYHKNSGRFQHFLTAQTGNNESSKQINDIKEDRFGNYWVGTYSGLFLLSNKKRITEDSLSFAITRFIHDSANNLSISDNYVNSIVIDENNVGWAATYGGLNKFIITKSFLSKPGFIHFTHDANDPSSVSSNDLYNVFEDAQHRIWTVSFDATVDLVHQGNQISFQHFSVLKNVTHDNRATILLSIFIDRQNRAWVATKSFGLLVFDVTEKDHVVDLTNMRRFANNKSDASSINNDFVWRTFQDKEGIIWIGTYKGLSKCNIYSENFHAIKTRYSKINLDTQHINCIYRSNGNTWLGSDHDVFWLLKNDSITEFKLSTKEFTQEQNEQNYITEILQSAGGNLYVASARGLFIFPSAEAQKMLRGKNKALNPWFSSSTILKANTVLSLKGSGRFIYIGAGNGLYKIDDTNFSVTKLIDGSKLEDAVRDVTIDRENNVWLATEGGVLCYHTANATFKVFKHSIGDTSSISSTLAETVFIDRDNNLWVGTQFGFNRFIPSTKKFKTYHIKDGLPDEQVTGITQDKNGKLWVSTFKGIAQFDPHTNSFHNYNESDGLNAARYERNCIFCCDDGMLIAGCDNGINSFYPNKLFTNKQPPPVHLTDMSVFTQSVFNAGYEKLRDAFISGKELVLSYQQNFFNISFVALNYLNTEKNEYAYMLQGVDHGWVYCGNNRNANYTDIAPGHYVFKVKAANNDGVWNEQGVSIPVTILPPWWQTWSFRIGFILAVLALIFFVTRYYFAQKLKLQKEQFERERAVETVRVRISQDIHDEIGSGLTKISLMSQRLKTNIQHKKEVDPALLDKITESSKEVVGNLGEIIWTVNPKHDNLQSLLSYLRNYISNFFEHTTIDCSINFPDEIPSISISPDLKHNLFLVIKESLNNIVKHAAATKVQVNFEFADRTFCFEIMDNGKGIADMKGRDFGNGLINMKNRMGAVHGKFEIESEQGKGTKIILKGNVN